MKKLLSMCGARPAKAFGLGALVAVIAAWPAAGFAGEPPPLQQCLGVSQGAPEAGYAAVLDVIDGTGATQWTAKVPLPSSAPPPERPEIHSAALDSTRSRLVFVHSLEPDKFVVASRDGRLVTFSPGELNHGSSRGEHIHDVTWENDGALRVVYLGHNANRIMYVEPGRGPVSDELRSVTEDQVAFSCVRSRAYRLPVCVDGYRIESGTRRLMDYPYWNAAWQPGVGNSRRVGLTPAAPTWRASEQPLLQFTLMSVSSGRAQVSIRSKHGSSQMEFQPGLSFIESSEENVFSVRVTKVQPHLVSLKVTRLPEEIYLSSFRDVVDLGALGLGVFVQGRLGFSTDLMTFTSMSPSLAQAGRLPHIQSLGRDLSSMERVRRTHHQTLELSGKFGFLELGYAIRSSPPQLTLGKMVKRPAWNPLHPGRKMLEWRC